ncbi:nucleotide sugar dehydrogenase [Corynebacterium sp. Marseille-P3884]|uniref:nucleotide sugar dehydrogenase n=1 Tax=Corynebacterium sp. Marseille-P3884 TaxID=2495409 RepID=UPI001FF0B658|nr:nucleotide sugar dehydrogenase [Corynebacterium sp. Marseille-P3884]
MEETQLVTAKDLDSCFDLCVLGLGYIGLPTAVVFAQSGLRVLGVDINADRVRDIGQGTLRIDEPGLKEALDSAMKQGCLRTSTDVQPARHFLIAVPTPLKDDKTADVSNIWAAAEAIAPVLSRGDLVILESTSPPGTTKALRDYLADLRKDLNFDSGKEECVSIAYCPERVMPGRILNEFATNSRVVGGIDTEATERAAHLYSLATKSEVLKTDAPTAEMVKLAENAYRDVNIAFANELSMLAAEHDVDAWELVQLANNHPRVNILNPGPGVGGHCIAVDPWFLASTSDNAPLIETARGVNNGKTRWVVEEISCEIVNGAWEEIVFYGVTYKADVDDLRESPALAVVDKCLQRFPDKRFFVVDPMVKREAHEVSAIRNAELVTAFEAGGAGVLHVLLVAHSAFETMEVFADSTAKVLDFVGLRSSRRFKLLGSGELGKVH